MSISKREAILNRRIRKLERRARLVHALLESANSTYNPAPYIENALALLTPATRKSE